MHELDFIEANRGRWVIRHANILVTAKSFFTKQLAEQWARWNYKGAGDYEIERIPKKLKRCA